MGPLRWGAVAALALGLVLAACGDDDSAAPGPSSTTSTSPNTTATSWSLIDGVPAFRKAGILAAAGLDYEPEYDSTLRQTRASFTLTADRAVFGFAPERGAVSFDRVQLGAVEGPATVWPFVIEGRGELTVFADATALADCEAAVAEPEPFSAFGLVGDVDGEFLVAEAACAELEPDGDRSVGALGASNGVTAFGVMLTAGADGGPSPTVTVESLALVDSDATSEDVVRVDVVGLEHAVAIRSADPTDEAALDELHILRADGTAVSVEGDVGSGFEFSRDLLGTGAKVWIDDYGLQHFVQQGPWIDPDGLTSTLMIDMTPKYGPWDGGPPSGSQHRRPHELQVWNGSSLLAVQQFHGLNWNNNLGQADRDRSADNPNGCARAAWFGGSYVQALQTRVDQKPALIAEALLDGQGDGCHEVFSFARSLYSVETHADNARRLVEDFGVTHLIFAVSGNELCRMNDEVYTSLHGVAADTPVHWRFIDGELVAPVTRSRAEEASLDPSFERDEVCSFSYESGAAGAAAMIDKLDALGDLMEGFGPDVEVSFFVLKGVLAGNSVTADNVVQQCLATGHDCVLLDEPAARMKPEDLVAIDANPHLLRYVGDGHPNPRANQHIGEGLAAVIGELEQR